MEMSQHWRRLHLTDHKSAPPLLYKYITTTEGYEFYLTDLVYIWSERLNHADILHRADDEETSIDPSEDAEQFNVLLQKIGDALLGSKDSHVVVTPGVKTNSLEVATTTQLPAPLKPLQWTLYLSREPSAELTKQLLLPLLKVQVERDRRERSLLDQLKEKDWALGKIFDKIDTSGLDLSTVFPGIAGLRGGKRGTSLSHAAKFVKGVAPFDEEAWRGSFDSGNDGLAVASDLMHQISDSSDLFAIDRLDVAPDRWWENLDVDDPVSKPSRKKRTEAISTEPHLSRADRESDTSSDEDEFQRQETPPRLKRGKPRPQQNDHHATESDDEARPVSQQRRTPSTRPQPKQKPKGLGVIGGAKAAPRTLHEQSPSSSTSEKSPEPPMVSRAAAADEETDSDEALSPPRSKQVANSQKPRKSAAPSQKRVLGTIGGRKVKPKDGEQPSLPGSPVASTDDEGPSAKSKDARKPGAAKHTGKLGVIGGNKAKNIPSRTRTTAAAEETASEDEMNEDLHSSSTRHKVRKPSPHPSASSRSPSPVSKQPKPPPEPERELTAQEKADKKREELKRQLEAKSKAPAKKKRKF